METVTPFYHRPVLLEACLEGLNLRRGGTALDCTLGGGGHSAAMLERIGPEGHLIGIDRDREAIAAASARLEAVRNGARLDILHGNFHDAPALLRAIGVRTVDGILVDLGVSSHQLDVRERGFSYHDDAPLDMRMDQSQSRTAADLLNALDEDALTRIFYEYGEEKWARQIARVICDRRRSQPYLRTSQLVEAVDAAIPKRVRAAAGGSHPARRTFQALRIAVNDEIGPLEAALEVLVRLLNPGGRLAVITFHSIEDRIVKETFRTMENPCVCPRGVPYCICGRRSLARRVNRKPIEADAEELSENPRSRSARLRIVERRDDAAAFPLPPSAADPSRPEPL